MKALVVDDEVWIRDFVREVLESEGFEVSVAATGREGADCVRDNPDLALVVTDILMPEQDGLQLIREIGRVAVPPKVLAISGGGAFARPDPFLGVAKYLGANATLPKPFSDEDLKKTLVTMGFPSEAHG